MSVTVERNSGEPGLAYKMTFREHDRRFSVKAKDMREVNRALEHYMGDDHTHIVGSIPDECPLCRRSIDENKKSKKRMETRK